MRGYSVFELRDVDGDVVFKGTCNEIAYKLKVVTSTVHTAVRRKTKLQGYEVVKTFGYVYTEDKDAHEYVQEREREYRLKKKLELQQKREERLRLEDKDPKGLAYLILHLIDRNLPNCYCNFDPFPWLPDLYDMGVNCTAHEWVTEPINSKLTTQHRRKPKREGYIVEVRERWTTGHSA